MKREPIKFVLLGILFLAACALSFFRGGPEPIGMDDLYPGNFIAWEIRFPKTVTALCVGAALSVAGLLLQVIFRNPLAGPYVLGISSGSALMVALVLLAGNSFYFFGQTFAGKSLIVGAAITGSLLVTILILAISRRISSNVVLLLIGLMFSHICAALQTALEYFSDPASLKTFVIWGMGSLTNTTSTDLYLLVPFSLVSIVSLLFFIKPLNALLLGENYARNVGVDFQNNRFYLILISSVLTGVCTAFCGPIAFLGIAVPILSRMIFSTSRQQVHFASCILLGSTLLLFSDWICNAFSRVTVLPVNMITTIIGAPLVIYLMFKNKSW